MTALSAALAEATRDIVGGARRLRLASWLAATDLEARYHRTVFGSFWSLLSQAVWVGSIALAFSLLFRISLTEFLPYLAVGMGLWTFLSGVLVEAPSIFTRNAPLISTYRYPLSLYVHRGLITQFIQLAHYMIVAAVALALVQQSVGWQLLLFIPAMVIYFGVGFAVMVIFGFIGARYRDFQQVVPNVLQLLFLLTPIFWKRELVASHPWIADINPLYHLVEIGRGSILNTPFNPAHWIFCVTLMFVLLAIAWLMLGTQRRSLYYWL